jgi:4-amino-4-deoxy-L-arabinose transferase-like glycosyltransferase
MICPRCGHQNRASAEFCGDCGHSLQPDVLCAACGSTNPAGHRFCDLCGTELNRQVGFEGPGQSQQKASPDRAVLRDAWTALSSRLSPTLSRPGTSRALLAAGALAAVLGQLSLLFAQPSSDPPGVGVALLVLGLALFALGSTAPEVNGRKRSPSFTRVESPSSVFRATAAFVSAAFGLVMLLVLWYRLANDSTSGLDLLLWIAAMISFAVPFALRLRVLQIKSVLRYRRDIIVVLALVGIFLALNMRDLEDWYYSAIGDEYAFYDSARGILENGLSKPFSQAGVYEKHPVLNSAYQAVVMAVFGQGNFAWRLASVLSVALTIPGIYLMGMTLGNRRVAIASAMLLAFSHYLFAYAHTGYNTIHTLAPTVWAIALFTIGLRRSNPLLLYASGLVAGLGFYALFTARVILPIMLLFVLAVPGLRKRILDLWPIALGAVIAVAPIFLVNRGAVVSRMLAEVPGGYSSVVSGPVVERILANLSKNLLAFNYNPDVFHYVSGALLDPVTAVLAVLGVGLALGRLRNERFKLLLVWALVAVTVSGILSPYPQVAISRLNFVIPPLVLLAGFGASHLWDNIPVASGRAAWRWIGVGAIATLSCVILALNIWQFWYDTPKVYHLTQEAVAIGAVRSKACGGDATRTIIVGRQTEPLLKPALASYYPDGGVPLLIDHAGINPDRPLDVGSAKCVIFANPNEDTARAALEDLRQRYVTGRTLAFSDRAGKGSVQIFALGDD